MLVGGFEGLNNLLSRLLVDPIKDDPNPILWD